MAYHTAAVEFAVLVAHELPAIRGDQVNELLRLSRRHRRLQEKACNESVADGHDARCEGQILALCREIGCTPIFSGDPRGCTVKIQLPSGHTNDWGGVGVCVPQ